MKHPHLLKNGKHFRPPAALRLAVFANFFSCPSISVGISVGIKIILSKREKERFVHTSSYCFSFASIEFGYFLLKIGFLSLDFCRCRLRRVIIGDRVLRLRTTHHCSKFCGVSFLTWHLENPRGTKTSFVSL